MEWLLRFSASEGTRFFWSEARKLFRVKPLDSLRAAEEILRRLDPLVQASMQEEGSTPAFIEHARLAIAFWDRLLAHRMTPPAAARVRNVLMASCPEEAPRLLRRPWLVEVEKPLEGQRLYGDTTALGAHYDPASAQWMLIGWMIVNGEPRVRQMVWVQNWTRDMHQKLDVAEEGYEWRDGAWVEVARMPAGQFDERRDWFREGVRFATILGALLEAENSFLRTHDKPAKAERGMQTGSGRPRPPGWITRHITLDGTDTERTPPKSTGTPLVADGLALTEVPVREYVRWQRCGEGNQERKWVRIKAHTSHRWTSPNPTRIVVHDE